MPHTVLHAPRPLTRVAVVAQAWPIMVGQASVPLVGLVDTLVIGRTGNASALAGVAHLALDPEHAGQSDTAGDRSNSVQTGGRVYKSAAGRQLDAVMTDAAVLDDEFAAIVAFRGREEDCQ